jgi:CheY-like chemotaxis protein
LELINEILDLSLIESGKATISRESVSLADVMLECRAMIESQVEKRGLGLTFPRFDVPCFVKADRTRLKQILINLLYNAVKYNKPGGAVAVECIPSPPDSIRISVRDTGPGLTPEQIAQLFQPFNRLGKEGGAEEGTGIGLVVTKRLVELMGGAIGMESVVGVGSVFWVELKLTHAPHLDVREAGDAALAGMQVPDGTRIRTVLYVEDNPANLELVEQIIARRTDLRLLGAADAKLGIEFALAYQPEVILMDINLPGMSGVEAMKILRADLSTAHIPIIALSANALPHDIKKAMEAGFFNYLTKPIMVNQLLGALDAALKFSQTTSRRAAKKEQG